MLKCVKRGRCVDPAQSEPAHLQRIIGSWLLPRLGIHLGSGLVPAIIGATIGAIILLLTPTRLQAREVVTA